MFCHCEGAERPKQSPKGREKYSSISLVVAILFLVSGCGITVDRTVIDELHSPASLKHPVAHRGVRIRNADNSKEAISDAIDHGVKLIEIDIRKNKDGTLFLFHDAHLKTKNYSGPADWVRRAPESLTDLELKNLGHPKPFSGNIITFSEALNVIKDHHVAFQLDLKGDDIDLGSEALKIARLTHQEHQLIVQCDTINCLQTFQKSCGVLARVYGNLDELLVTFPEITHIELSELSPEVISKIHSANSRVLVKTLDDVTDNKLLWCQLFRQGVDLIMTDHPIEVLQVKCGD